MSEIEILFIIIIFLFLLNTIKINKNEKNKNKQIDKFNQDTYNFDKTQKIKKFGEIQYDVVNNDNDNKTFEYQDYIINYDNKINIPDKVNISDNIKLLNNYNDLTELNNKLPLINYTNIDNPNFLKTNLPSQENIIYDSKFYQPSDADIYNPTDFTQINYADRKIQDVYQDIINDVKKDNKQIKENKNEIRIGASNLKTFTDIDWEYNDDDDGMSFDPRISTYAVI